MFTAGVTLQVWRLPPGGAVLARTETADEDGWAIAPPLDLSAAAEVGTNPGVVRDRRNGYRQSATALVATDEVDWGEGRFRVVGPPANWPDPWRGSVVGAEVLLERSAVAAPGWVFPDQVAVRTRQGANAFGPAFAAAVSVACLLASVTATVIRDSTGDESVVTGELTADPSSAAVLVPGSQVTLPDGQVTTVLDRQMRQPDDRSLPGLAAVVCRLGQRRLGDGSSR